MKMSPQQTKVANTLFTDLLLGGEEGVKKANVMMADYTRLQVLEDSFFRKILPMERATDDELVPQIDTDEPVMLFEREPGSPAAVGVPFGGANPAGLQVRGHRYALTFYRIQTRKFYKDVVNLRTYRMDIRQVLSDNSIKKVLELEDTYFLESVNALLGSMGATVPFSGTVQWEEFFGGIDRNTLEEFLKVLPRTPSRLETARCLINNLTVREVMKFGRDEMGGDKSQDLLWNGWTEQRFMNVDWMVTIKQNLVPDDNIFGFADPRFMGQSRSLEDLTMHVRTEAYMVHWYSYESIGSTIGNTNSVCRGTFN